MESKGLWRLFFILSWIFAFFMPFVSSRLYVPRIFLEERLFVALAGSNLDVVLTVKPVNQSGAALLCFSPDNKKLNTSKEFLTTTKDGSVKGNVKLTNLQSCDSGEYWCTYETAKAYWFLLVRDGGYQEQHDAADTECIILVVFTIVLLVFSVAGSVYVFRDHWRKPNSEGGNISRRQEQNRNERMSEEVEEDNMDVITSPSTSFYASLEPQPRSIYDVLDRSAANREAGQRNAESNSKESHSEKKEAMQQQDGVFESVYENF